MRTLLIALPLFAVACGDHCPDEPGTVCLYAGEPEIAQFGPEDVDARESPLYLPQDVTFGPDGTAYILDFNNHRIRAIDEEGAVHTIAGTGFLGDGPEGPALEASFNHPTNVAFSPDDPDTLHIAAWHNSRVESIDLATGILSFECGTGARAFSGDGGPAVDAELDLPSAVAFDDDANLYISDQANQLIRKVDPEGTITTFAGSQRDPGFSGDGGPASEAQFHASVGQAADPSSRITIADGVLYLADTDNHVIRTIDLETEIVDTLAGTPETPGYADGAAAMFRAPRDVAIADDGTVYVADTDNHCIRAIDPDGIVSTVAGRCGEAGYEGDGGPATEALFRRPYGVTMAPDGRVIIADTNNHVFRVLRP